MPVLLPTVEEYARMLSVESRRRAVARLYDTTERFRAAGLLGQWEQLTADEILRLLPPEHPTVTAGRRALLASDAYSLPGFRRAKAVHR